MFISSCFLYIFAPFILQLLCFNYSNCLCPVIVIDYPVDINEDDDSMALPQERLETPSDTVEDLGCDVEGSIVGGLPSKSPKKGDSISN